MKKFVYLFITLLVACHSPQKQSGNMVTVSILPQKYVVDQIAGNLVEVNVLVPPGSSPHNYSVLPSQMKNLTASRIWLQIGLLTFEDAWKSQMQEINPKMEIVNTSHGIVPIEGTDHHDEAGPDEHSDGTDPHVWIAPAEVKVLARNTLEALKRSFPENAGTFDQNYSHFVAHIDSVSAQIGALLQPLANRNILIFHPTLGYFAREFNLTQIPLELDGKEPSPKHMKNIVDEARAQNIRVVFIQKEFDSENALQLSREIGGDVVVIDPLAYNWDKQILEITHKIAGQ